MVKINERKGFTLIELLVVIAIIGMLMAVIIPSLRKAKTQARMLICRNNIKSMQMGLILYLEDNNQRMFSYGDWLWIKQIEDQLGDLDDIRYCPEIVMKADDALVSAQDAASDAWGSSKEPWVWKGQNSSGTDIYEAGGLGFNGWLYGNMNEFVPSDMQDAPYTKMIDVRNPGKTPVFADSNWVDSWPQNTNTLHPELISDPQTYYDQGDRANGTSVTAMGRFLVNRHFNLRINIAFMDNHVEMIDMEDLWTLAWHRNARPNFEMELPRASN